MNKTLRRTLFILIPILLVIGYITLIRPMTVYRLIHPWGHQQVINDVFKDQEIYDVMMSSPQVTAQRLHQKSKFDDLGPVLIRDYDKDAPVTLTADQAQKLKSLLQSQWSYEWDVTSCFPDYGVVYNFQSGGHTVRVAFCFKCNIIGVFDGDDDSSNRVNFTSQFDPMRGQMIALSKTIFPNDKEILALKQKQ